MPAGGARARTTSRGSVAWVWAGEEFLREALDEVDEARPLWFPEDRIPQDPITSSAALAAGLRFRRAEQTAREALDWVRETGHDELAAGLSTRREQELISSLR